MITAKVEDSARWLETFPTHGDLFRALGTTVIHYTANDENEVALYEEVDDLDAYFEMMESPETAAAMEHDGVDASSVRVFVLDQEWRA